MQNLTNKTIWITGASSGIGEALSKEFALKGANIVLSARRETELQRVKNALNLPDNRVLILPLDMQKPAEFAAKTQAVIQHFGTIDVMVHNAGISQRETFLNISPQDAQRLMDTNFTNVVALTREVLPLMLAQKSGAFLVTSSVSGKIGTPYRTMYAASKHALQGFFDGLRGEVWQQGIQVTIVCPGYIHTPISYNALGKNGQPYGKMDVNQAKGIPVDICAKKMVKDTIASVKKQVLQSAKEEITKKLLGGKDTTGTPTDPKKKLEETGKGLLEGLNPFKKKKE